MEVTTSVDFDWEPNARDEIEEAPDDMLYDIAKVTLDLTVPHIPLSKKVNSGRLRNSSTAGGVKKDSNGYYIGSYVSYAKRVWNFGPETNWSTPNTFGKWYEEVYTKQYNNIVKQAVERNKLK